MRWRDGFKYIILLTKGSVFRLKIFLEKMVGIPIIFPTKMWIFVSISQTPIWMVQNFFKPRPMPLVLNEGRHRLKIDEFNISWADAAGPTNINVSFSACIRMHKRHLSGFVDNVVNDWVICNYLNKINRVMINNNVLKIK